MIEKVVNIYKESVIISFLNKVINKVSNVIKESFISNFFSNQENIVEDMYLVKGIKSFFSKIDGKIRIPKVIKGSLIVQMFCRTEYIVYFMLFSIAILPWNVGKYLIALGVISLISRKIIYNDVKFKMTHTSIYILIFAFVNLVTIFTSVSTNSDVYIAISKILYIMLAYFVVIFSINDKQKLYTALTCLVFGGVLVAGNGIRQLFMGKQNLENILDKTIFTDISFRAYSTLYNPNILAAYLLMIIPLAVALVFIKENKYRFLTIYGTIVLFVGILVTYSRGSYLALLIALGIFAVMSNKKLIPLYVIGLCIMAVMLPDNIIHRFSSITNMGESSNAYRLNIWFSAIDVIKKYWVTGLGAGNNVFDNIFPLFTIQNIHAPHAHSLYLQYLIVYGIIGMVAFMMYVIAPIKEAISTVMNKAIKSDYKLIILGLASALIATLIYAIFECAMLIHERVYVVFYVIIALTNVTYIIYNEDVKREERKQIEN